MRVILSHVLLLATISMSYISCDDEFSCLNLPKDGSKITITSLPEIYRYVDVIKRSNADFTEYLDQKRNISVLKCEKEGQRFDCIIDRSANTLAFVNKTGEPMCQMYSMSNEKAPHERSFFDFDQSLIKLNRKILTMFDFLNFINSSSMLIVDPSNHTDHEDHGIPVRHLLACQKSVDDKFWMEFKICASDKNFSINGVKNLLSVPTRVDFKIYETLTPKKVEFNAVYELFDYHVDFEDEDNYHLPPEGVYCHSRNQTKEMPSFPDDFSVSIEYIDTNSKIVDHAQVYYSLSDKIFGIDFSLSGKEEPIVSSIGRDLQPGHYRIVQDFVSGLQYNLEYYARKCLNVLQIPANAEGTTSVVGADKRRPLMKEAFELLFSLPKLNYTYVGQRFEDGVFLDEWNAFRTLKPQKNLEINYTYEILSYPYNWSRDGFTSTINRTFPAMLKIYSIDNFNQKNLTIHKYSNFIQISNSPYVEHYNTTNFGWTDLDVADCSPTFAVYNVQINETLDNIKSAGIGLVIKSLKEKIVNVTGIRPLRLNNFQFRDVTISKSTNVTFTVAKKSSEKGTKTMYYKAEVESHIGMNNFNKRISENDVLLDPIGKDKHILALKKATLSMVNVFSLRSIAESPIIRPVGYTGGSMATLSFFMLFIGGAGGVFLAYQYLKRARSGIAYQIYE